jgi:DNA polymerase-3 subunit alpha
MCSWINSYIGKNEHLSPCLTEAQRMGVKVYQPKWGSAFGKTCLYEDGIILGTSSLKFCNAQMADDLTELYKSKKYTNFIDLMTDIKDKTSINARQLEVLIGSNFFDCFGKNKYLSSLKDLYEELGGKSQIKKDKLQEYVDKYGITEEIISKHSAKGNCKII